MCNLGNVAETLCLMCNLGHVMQDMYPRQCGARYETSAKIWSTSSLSDVEVEVGRPRRLASALCEEGRRQLAIVLHRLCRSLGRRQHADALLERLVVPGPFVERQPRVVGDQAVRQAVASAQHPLCRRESSVASHLIDHRIDLPSDEPHFVKPDNIPLLDDSACDFLPDVSMSLNLPELIWGLQAYRTTIDSSL